MGKINKFANLYDKNGTLIRQIDPKKGRLTDFSIQELEQYLDSLDKNSKEYQNCMSWLIGMYQNPKTEADKQYIQELQENLIKKLQDEQNEKKRREAAGKTSLEQMARDLDQESKHGPIEDAEIVEESVSADVTGTNTGGTEQ